MESFVHSETDQQSEMRIRFATSEEANMVKSALEVDEELQPQRIERIMTVDDCVLVV